MPLLAAITFSDPLMLIGLLAAGIPVVLHLLNRIRSPIVPFPTLRFLKITAQKTSRRRQLEQWLLLALRMAVLALAAMAIAHPLIRGGSSTLAYSFIIMLVVGMGLLVLAAVWITSAIDQSKSTPAPTSAEELLPAHALRAPAAAKPQPAKYWSLSAAALILALILSGYAAFGLGTNRYFSGDSGEFSGQSTAVAIILDNSHSMLARQDSISRCQRAKEQVRQLLVEALHPAEAVVLATNPGATPASDALTSDTTSLLGYVDKLATVGRAKPMKERIRTALTILSNTQQPNRMLIILSDFARPAFADADVLASLKDVPNAKDTQVVLMPLAQGSPPADVGIASFLVAQGGGQPVVGSEITFDATILNNGDAADVQDLALYVDDRLVPEIAPRVQLGPAGSPSARATIKIAYRLTSPGYHRYTLKLKNGQDAMEWDNQRQLVLNVAEQIRVLVIGPDSAGNAGPRSRSAAFYLNAALDPFGATKDRQGQPWSIKPTYRTASQIADAAGLSGYAAVFLCDVPRISEPLADALVKYSKSGGSGGAGGRIIWILGPSIDANNYNAVLTPRELLPAPLNAPVVSAVGSTIDWVDLSADIFANLYDNQEPFRSVIITGRWALQANQAQHGHPISKLADGSLLITQQSGPGSATGEIYTVLSSPSAAWSNLGSTSLLVPMASRMALGDSGHIKNETSFEPGQNMLIAVPTASAGLTLDITTPAKQILNVRSIMSGDVPRWYFDKTLAEGTYTWISSDRKITGMFVVNPPSEEADLLPTDVDALSRETPTARPALIASTAQDLLKLLEKQSEGTTLAPGMLGMVLMLVILEALFANRHKPSAKTFTYESLAPTPRAEPDPARTAA